MVIRIAISGIIVCFLCIILKKYCGEFVLPVELIFVCFSVCSVTEVMNDVIGKLSEIYDKTEFTDDIMVSLIKGTGICIITKISSDICLENGNKLVSDVVELTGRIMLVLIALPYVQTVVGIASAFVE